MRFVWAEAHHAPEIADLLNRYVLRGDNVTFGFFLEPRPAETIEMEILSGKYRYLLLFF